MSYTQLHLKETEAILQRLDVASIERLAAQLAQDQGGGGPDILYRRGRRRRQLLPCRE